MENKFNIFNFKLGKLNRDFRYYLKVGTILNVAIDLIDLIPGVDDKTAFNSIDRIQQALRLDFINDYIIKDDRFIGYRIDRILDEAIEKIQQEKKNED